MYFISLDTLKCLVIGNQDCLIQFLFPPSSWHIPCHCNSSIDICEWMAGFLLPVVMVREEQIQMGSVYSLNPADCPQGSFFSLMVDIMWVKKNLGLGVNFFKCCWLGVWRYAVLPQVENHCSGRFLQRNLIKHLSIKPDLIFDLWFSLGKSSMQFRRETTNNIATWPG